MSGSYVPRASSMVGMITAWLSTPESIGKLSLRCWSSRSRVSIAKIAKIAKRLGLEPSAIILPDEQAGNVFTPGVVGKTSTDAKTLQPAPTPKQNSVRLALQADGFDINVRFAAIPDQARLKQQAISLMASLVSDLNLQDGYDPDDLDATPGSVIVTVKLSARDAATLLFAFMAGKLTDSKVESITINDRRKLAASPLAAKGDGEGAEKQQAASALGRVESQGRATERPTTGDLSARIQSVLSELTEDERAAIYSRVYGAKAPSQGSKILPEHNGWHARPRSA